MIGKAFELKGSNFQSWKNFELPVSGFTVIVGASDRGKSAIIRSLRGLLRNEVSSSHINWGAKEATVTLTPEGGDVISLSRNAKTTNYTVGEEEFSKLAGNIPPAIQELKCGVVEVGGVKLDPIFAGQFDQQFMLSLGPTELNSIFGLFSSTEKLNAGKKLAAIKNTELGSNAKFLAKDIQEAEVKKGELETLVQEFEELSVTLESTDKTREALEDATALTKSYRVTQDRLSFLSGVRKPLPSFEELHTLYTQNRLVRGYQRSLGKKELLAVTKQQLPTLDATASLYNSNRLVSRYRKAFEARATYTGHMTELPKNPELRKKYEVVAQLKGLLNAKKTVGSISSQLKKAKADMWSKIIVLQKVVNQLSRLKELSQISSKIETLRSSLNLAKNQYQSESEQLSSLQKTGIKCPKCGNIFDQGDATHGD